jgi:hypothetical protein
VSIVAEEGFKLYPKQVVIATGKGFAPLSFPKLLPERICNFSVKIVLLQCCSQGI